MARTKHYSDFLTSWGSLVGIPSTRITTELASVANTVFNTAINQMWSQGPWLDVCPNGEARFVGNRLTYTNDLSKTAYWTANAVTITAKSTTNPLDGRLTANKMMETSANAAHNVTQSVMIFPDTDYALSAYVRANGRDYVYLTLNDGVTTFSTFFNLSAGTVGTSTNTDTTTVIQQANGFYLCTMQFTSTNTVSTTANYQLSISTDGSTLSYVGDPTKGLYVYGCLAQQVSNTTINDSRIDWDQTGEDLIDVVFNVTKNSPYLSVYPSSQGYSLTPNGIQIVSSGTTQSYVNGVATVSSFPVTNNPVFLYYRRTTPSFSGDAYSATDTYVVDDQIYYTTTAGYGDYYKCLVATTAGQNPDTTPTSWEVIPIYEVFFQYCVYQSYGDWLISDGQMDKATGAYGIAQDKMNTEFDKRERQMGDVLPMKVATHLTSRSAF